MPSVWAEGTPIGSFCKYVRVGIHPEIGDKPWLTYSRAPFYIQIVIFVLSLFGYAGIWRLKRKTFLGRFLQNVFTYLCKCLVFPFMLLCLSNFVSHILLLCQSASPWKWTFLLVPCLAVVSFPMLLIGALRSLVDISVVRMPYTTTDVARAVQWFFLTFFWVVLECLFQVVDRGNNYGKGLLAAVMFVIGVVMTWVSFRTPFFLSPLSLFLSAAVSLTFCISSLLVFIQVIVSWHEMATVEFILVVFSVVVGIAVQAVRRSVANKRIKRYNFDIRELKNKAEVMDMFTFCYEKNQTKLANREIMRGLEEKYPGDCDILIMEMRFLMDDELSTDVLETSVYLMKLSLNRLYHCLQLCALIERSIEFVGGNNAMTLRMRQLDQILEKCVDEHVEFWRCVLLNNLDGIAESAIRLCDKTENARMFFKQLNIEKEREQSNFWIKYVDFIMNITADLTALHDVKVDSSKPIRYDQRFAMNQPRRDAKAQVEKAGSQFRPFQEVGEPPSHQGRAMFPRLRGGPAASQGQLTDLISRDRIELCEAAEKVRLGNTRSRFGILASTNGLMAVMALVIFILVTLAYGDFLVVSKETDAWYQSLFALYNLTFTVVLGLTGPIYGFENAISDPKAVTDILEKTILYLESNAVFMARIDEETLNSVGDACTAIIGIFSDTVHEAVAVSPEMLHAAELFTNVTQTVLIATEEMSQTLAKKHHFLHDLFPKLQYAALALFVLLVPFELYGLIRSCSNLKWLFWQPLVIDKTEISDVFQVFLRLATTERRKSRVDPEVYNREVERQNRTRRFRFKMKYIGAFFSFTFEYLLIAILMLLVDIEVRGMSECSLSLLNCSTVFVHYQSSIYRLFPTSTNVSAGAKYTKWYYSTIQVFAATIYHVLEYNSSVKLEDIDPNLDTSGIAPPVESTLVPFDSLPLFPVPNAVSTDGFVSSVQTASSTLLEVVLSLNSMKGVYPETNLPATRANVQIENGARMYQFMIDLHQSCAHKVVSLQVGIIVLFIVFLILEIVFIAHQIFHLISDNNLIALFVRLILLLPDRTPFVEPMSTEIKLLEKMPESPTSKIMECFPVGMVIVDSNNKCLRGNRLAREYFGEDIVGKRTKELSSEKYLKKSRIHLSRFPLHPFDDPSEIDYNSVVVFTDVTVFESNRRLWRSIQAETRKLRKRRIPPSVSTSTKTQSIMILDSYAIVEVSLALGALSEDMFMALRAHLSTLIDPIPTVFLCELNRGSIFIVFTSFNSPSHQRQFLRDAMRCAVIIDDLLMTHGISEKAKVAVTQGNDCLVKSTDDEFARVEFYAVQLPKSFGLMQYVDFGQTILEWSILKSVASLEISPDSIHSGTVGGIDLDYCVMQNDDPQWKSMFHVHRRM